jgi:CheY-like chemotaxis protein
MEKLLLLVEDDYVDAISFKRALKKLNASYDLQIARNGRDGIEMLKAIGKGPLSRKPDIIILDLNMPRMNGIEFLEILRADPELRGLTVFITTTSGDDVDMATARKLGISGYIIKPMNFDGQGHKESSMDNFNLMLELLK